MDQLKHCIDCPAGLLKPLSEFWVSRKGKTLDGYKSTCKECSKIKRRVWAAQHRDREREWNAAKYAADPSYFVQKADKRKDRLRGDQFVESIDRSVVYKTHDGVCGICEEAIIGKFHVDHIMPLSKGGLHCYANVQPAHPFCNRSKKDKVI